MKESTDYNIVLIDKTPEYELRLKIPRKYLEKNDIELGKVSTILNEINGDYLILDAYLQGVWVPKEVIEFYIKMIGRNL